jgi:hypothetical protein
LHAHDITGDQFPGRHHLPARIAQHARADPQPPPQRLDNARRPALLREAQHGVDDEQCAHHGKIGEFVQHGGEHHDQLEHPRRQAPEFSEEREDRMPFLFGHLVVAVLLDTGCGVRASEARLGVHAERREGVGNRQGIRVGSTPDFWRRSR